MHSVSLTDDETAFMWLFIPAVKVPLDKSGNCARGGVTNLEKCSSLIRCIWWRVLTWLKGRVDVREEEAHLSTTPRLTTSNTSSCLVSWLNTRLNLQEWGDDSYCTSIDFSSYLFAM